MKWITDISHFLDKGIIPPLLPPPALKLAKFLGALIEVVSLDIDNPAVVAQVRCCDREQSEDCDGCILCWLDDDGNIAWCCEICEATGVISHWQHCPWDKRLSVLN